MLESITIRQIALIEEATIHFHDGMQVLTGETGAGKSIVVDSVCLILGGRADRDLIRSGCEKASVEAVFSAQNNNEVRLFMEHEGIEYDGSTVTIYREITTGGKNLCRICGVIMPVSKLKELTAMLIDLHGQSEHQFLTDPARHLAFLDQTGDANHKNLLKQVKRDHELFIENHRAYAKLVRQNENRESRMTSLERDLNELRKAHVETGEAERLLKKRKELADAERINGVLIRIRDSISGEENGSSSLSRIKDATDALKTISSADNLILELSNRCESAYFELEEIAYQISSIAEKTGYDPEILEKTEARLDTIHRLERKYNTDADEISSLLKRMENEYRQLAELEDQVNQMSAEHKRLLGTYRNTARKLTESRRNLASIFEKKMVKELEDLGMGNTSFQVAFIPNETGRPTMPTETGDDRIEFMISPNPGEPLKPLAKIASGGELSRLMLAVKTLESHHTGVQSMVFDEIDTGISGRMAQVVAEKMISISREKQVICVTHLPQIAAAADYQYLVQKSVSQGRTATTVESLDNRSRTEELGRMISGAGGITEESISYAAKMLKEAAAMKQNTKQESQQIYS